MPTYYLDRQEVHSDPIQELLSITFNGYEGYTIKIQTAVSVGIDTTWSGGTHRDWILVRRDGQTFQKNLIDAKQLAGKSVPLLPNSFMVTRDYFCGKDMGITIHIRPDEWNSGLLVDNTQQELTWAEKVVLCATRSYKSSYAGIKNYRFVEARNYTSITRDEWHEAVQSLMDKKFLAKNKAITPKGRNAINDVHLMSLKGGSNEQ